MACNSIVLLKYIYIEVCMGTYQAVTFMPPAKYDREPDVPVMEISGPVELVKVACGLRGGIGATGCEWKTADNRYVIIFPTDVKDWELIRRHELGHVNADEDGETPRRNANHSDWPRYWQK